MSEIEVRREGAVALCLMSPPGGFMTRTTVAELDAAVTELARRLAAGPTHAYGNTKALLNATFDRPLAEQLDAEAAYFADCAVSEDFSEGITAFLEKRAPKFKGR